MKRYITLVVAFVTLLAVAAQAQVPIGPFDPLAKENFDSLAPGAYNVFAGFSGQAQFSALAATGRSSLVAAGLKPAPCDVRKRDRRSHRL
ncbi:MAG: hypothetical protein ETSY2_29090 [Candidatus Entotheonella gemina]|uniref:Uncharacterized protein n=1 Tax=Candidatus Entotheonella gemina TaxID=1429439 RepID=W4M2K1_9BACT|nr:MAG: hypothetical protein ETSY2_29090 [Candidatus Entotheonella gemina]